MLNKTNYKKNLKLVDSLSNDKTVAKKSIINTFMINVKGKKFIKSDINNHHGVKGIG